MGPRDGPHLVRLLSPEEIGEAFQVDRRKVIEWTRRYGWPHVKVGRSIAFTEAQFEQIVALHSVDGSRGHTAGRMPGQTALSAGRSK